MSNCMRNILIAVLTLISLLSASMTRGEEASVIIESISSNFIEFDSTVAFEYALLTVTGHNDVLYKEEFGPGQIITYGLIDQYGHPLSDGSYRYQLQVVLKFSDTEDIEDTVARNSGSFTIKGRQIESQTLQEN